MLDEVEDAPAVSSRPEPSKAKPRSQNQESKPKVRMQNPQILFTWMHKWERAI